MEPTLDYLKLRESSSGYDTESYNDDDDISSLACEGSEMVFSEDDISDCDSGVMMIDCENDYEFSLCEKVVWVGLLVVLVAALVG